MRHGVWPHCLMDIRALLRMEIRILYGNDIVAPTAVLMWAPHRLGLPEILTVAQCGSIVHTLVLKRLLSPGLPKCRAMYPLSPKGST